MNVVRNWKKIMAIGCTHGELINHDVAAAVLLFKEAFKPHHVGHLGDAYDTRALRSGAKGTNDESAPIGYDIVAGQEFLYAYEPTFFTEGNHDFRPRSMMGHHNAIIAECARNVHESMMAPLIKMRTEFRPWSIWHAYEIGGFKWWHGVLYGENYLRDTANRWGNSVVAHAHRAGMAKGIRDDNPTCYGVGTMADIHAMGYAEHRAATLAWSHAVVYGEVCEDDAYLNIHEWKRGETEWRLPAL